MNEPTSSNHINKYQRQNMFKINHFWLPLISVRKLSIQLNVSAINTTWILFQMGDALNVQAVDFFFLICKLKIY